MLELLKVMDRYTTDHLVGISPENFKGNIRAFTQIDDAEMEGYEDATHQRDLSVRFAWGHKHDFGSFKIQGLMGNRHIEIVEAFVASGILPRDLSGKRVLDVGCWTGGTSLLLVGLGAEVVALEEVRKYARVVQFLADSFGIQDQLTVQAISLYDATTIEFIESFIESFDYVLLSGVLYHVTDPILALRILYNCLKVGGSLLVETQFMPGVEQLWRYAGPRQCFGDDGKRMGWNWFTPTLKALKMALEDVGFDEAKVWVWHHDRAFALARRDEYRDMLRAGLSNRKVL